MKISDKIVWHVKEAYEKWKIDNSTFISKQVVFLNIPIIIAVGYTYMTVLQVAAARYGI